MPDLNLEVSYDEKLMGVAYSHIESMLMLKMDRKDHLLQSFSEAIDQHYRNEVNIYIYKNM